MNHFICGSGNIHQEQQQEEELWVPSSSPRKSTRRICSCKLINKKTNNNNPYSTRGLDKFATVLSDLEEKRQKIYDQINAQDISLIRFGYSSSKSGWVPIVVKFRNQQEFKNNGLIGSKYEQVKQNLEPLKKSTIPMKSDISEEIQSPKTCLDVNTKEKGLLSSSVNLVKWRVPYYWAMVLVLILLCLAIFGRSFAIICTSIWWYLVPRMNAGKLDLRRLSMKKKDFNIKRMSEKKMDFHGVSSFKTKNIKTMERLSSM